MDMELEKLHLELLTQSEMLETTGGNWYNIYRVLAEELGDFIRGFKEGAK
jgi:hypothetical protein